MKEEWRVIENFDQYEISSFGNVRRREAAQGGCIGKILKWHTCTSNGYPVIRFRKDGKQHARGVHQLVAQTFIGPKPTGMQVRHLDGDKLNCRASNLAYGTPKQNGEDKIRHGRTSHGERCHFAKLTYEKAKMIREMFARGITAKDMAEIFQVSPSQIYRVVRLEAWIRDDDQSRERTQGEASDSRLHGLPQTPRPA